VIRPPPFLLLALVACSSGELNQGSARDLVMEHLETIAPRAINPDSFEVHVLEIGAPAATERAVRFRTIWPFTDTSGLQVDTSQVLTAQVQQAGSDWRIVRYDNALFEQIVKIVDEDRRRLYEELLDAVHHVYHVMTMHGWYYNEGGIPPEEIHRLVQADTAAHAQHTGMQWDLTPRISPQVAQVLWMTAPDSATCALPLTHGEQRPPGFEWVQDNIRFTCRGRGPGVYASSFLPQELHEIVERQGVLPPASR
jgi:hypothetical protein